MGKVQGIKTGFSIIRKAVQEALEKNTDENLKLKKDFIEANKELKEKGINWKDIILYLFD